MGPIPRSKVVDYANELEFDEVVRDALITIVAKLDSKFIKLSIAQRKKEFERSKPAIPTKRSK